ncbi:MATE efflux family protein [Actinidia rufa]|uniref:Protein DETOXIFICATION n=1 Tax=Actinidia rufa TaxID=165716 RepID=A0A7J0EJW6_9ERIC|nr:MATE efflux family protein [Actinidia rufa]
MIAGYREERNRGRPKVAVEGRGGVRGFPTVEHRHGAVFWRVGWKGGIGIFVRMNDELKLLPTSDSFVEELKKVSNIAAPMVVVTVSQIPLAGCTNDNGGAPQCALPLQCCNFHLSYQCQDPLISAEAGKYAIWLIPSLFPYAILESMVPYLQTQSLILPMLLCSTITLSFHIPCCWALVFKFELGTKGAALAISLSYWVNVILLGIYLKYSSACEKTRASFSKDVFLSIGEFFRFALPSAGMVCLEWWSFELVILLSGILPNPQLESSVLSICLTTTSLHYLIPYSISAAASTRVSNELGAGNSQAARLAVYTVMVLAVAETIFVATILFCCRFVLGFAYSNEKEIGDYVKEMTPLICLSIIMDSLQAVLSGYFPASPWVARGSGWQHIGAYINFGAFYLVGIPLAIVLGFVQHLRGKGIWGGIAIGSIVQVILLSSATCLINWQKQFISYPCGVYMALHKFDVPLSLAMWVVHGIVRLLLSAPFWKRLVDQGVNGLRIVYGILCALLSPPSDWGKGACGSWIEGCGLMLLIPSWLFVVQGGSGWLIALSGIFVCPYYILKAFGAYALIELSPSSILWREIMEAALLPENKEESGGGGNMEGVWGELKKGTAAKSPSLALPSPCLSPMVVSLIPIPRLRSNPCIDSSIAVFGMAGALETLCGQAYGAEQYQKLGIYTFASIFSLILICLPVSLLWTFLDKILINIGQDPSISHKAGKFAIWLIPSLFSYAILQSLVRYLQSQSLILSMLWCSVATPCFHIPVC